MDLETLFYIALIVLYFLIQARGSKKKKASKKGTPLPQAQRPKPNRAHSPSNPNEVSLSEALEQIRQVLQGEPEKAMPPRPEPPPPRQKLERPAPPPRKAAEPSYYHAEDASHHPEGRTYHAEEAFEARPAFAEAFPERRGTFESPRSTPHKRRPAAPPMAVEPVQSKKAASSKLPHQLTTAKAAREAFVLSEILGSPRALRKR